METDCSGCLCLSHLDTVGIFAEPVGDSSIAKNQQYNVELVVETFTWGASRGPPSLVALEDLFLLAQPAWRAWEAEQLYKKICGYGPLTMKIGSRNNKLTCHIKTLEAHWEQGSTAWHAEQLT